jgi:hypothetical protein
MTTTESGGVESDTPADLERAGALLNKRLR